VVNEILNIRIGGQNLIKLLGWNRIKFKKVFLMPLKFNISFFAGLWIRIRIRIGSGFNGLSRSGFGIRIRIQGPEKEENEEKIQTFILKFL
jgi:hypothetical protein